MKYALVSSVLIATLMAPCSLLPLVRGQDVEAQLSSEAKSSGHPRLVIVVGAAGEEPYGPQFLQWADRWEDLGKRQQWHVTRIGSQLDAAAASDKLQLQQAIESASNDDRTSQLWIVLIGHGTFARNVAKFNLVGPDVSAAEMKDWLSNCPRPVVVINCASSSGPFVPTVSGSERIVVSATRSGSEMNYARFGSYLSEAISSPQADIDHDREVSLLEAFLAACSLTERFYREEARLATEHAILDDNGDQAGTGGDFFRGIRPVKAPAAGKEIDGKRASRLIVLVDPAAPKFDEAQYAERSRLEDAIDLLRAQRNNMTEDVYLDQLEPLLLQLAEVYRQVEARSSKSN